MVKWGTTRLTPRIVQLLGDLNSQMRNKKILSYYVGDRYL